MFQIIIEKLYLVITVSAVIILGANCAMVSDRGSSFDRIPGNFLVTDRLTDGELEHRLQYKRVSGKQTSVGPSEGSPEGLVVREVSNGRQLLYLIYTGLYNTTTDLRHDDHALQLKECDVETQGDRVNAFLQQFEDDSRRALLEDYDTSDGSESLSWQKVQFITLASTADIPMYLRPITNFRGLRRQCRQHQKKVRKVLKSTRRLQGESSDDVSEGAPLHSRTRRAINDLFLLPGTMWCGNKDRASNKFELSGYVDADACCREHDKCPYDIPGLSTKFGIFNSYFTTMSACSCDRRSRRSLVYSLMIPHTKWCGVGNTASTYSHLGGNIWADACCREHDNVCPFHISSFQTKYGLTNWSMKTYNHCHCDRRFRTCLKSSNTGAANLVGRVFFDMVGAECFDFKKQKVCVRRSWWGTCQKYSVERRAVLRKPQPWVR